MMGRVPEALLGCSLRLARRSVKVLATACILLSSAHAVANDAQRADEFSKARERLADPNSDRRLAAMEAILKSGDGTLIDNVLQFALVSDDPNVRALAFRAYIASVKQFTFLIQLPPNIQRELDAVSGDPNKFSNEFSRKYPGVYYYAMAGLRFTLRLKEYDLSRNQGTWTDFQEASSNRQYPFTILGSRISSTIGIYFGSSSLSNCAIDFSSTRELKLVGNLACPTSGASTTVVKFEAPMF